MYHCVGDGFQTNRHLLNMKGEDPINNYSNSCLPGGVLEKEIQQRRLTMLVRTETHNLYNVRVAEQGQFPIKLFNK